MISGRTSTSVKRIDILKFEEVDQCVLLKICLLFDSIDENNNRYVGMYEAFQTFTDQIDVDENYKWKEKIQQIDRSMCVNEPSFSKCIQY